MSTAVKMPQMGESIVEGTIVAWFKKLGDKVERDEPLFEISTDKVGAEIPSPASGYLTEVLFGPGQTVEVDKVVATISDSQTATPTSSAAPVIAEKPSQPVAEAPSAPTAPATATTVEELRRTRSSPLVRKMAAERGIDIKTLTGTGISGRVTKQDLLSHVDKPQARPALAAKPATSKFDYRPQSGDRAEPFSPMRAAIAEHMVISRETSVHVTTVFEVDMTRVVKLRTSHRAAYAERGVNLTYTPFLMKAVVEGLKEFPILNSSVADGTVYYKSDINLGIAVALDWGLLVPVVKRAEELSLMGLSRAVNDLAERARAKKLTADEVQGGTFTITNPGVFGSLFGTPIINQPQVAILGVGAITKRPVVTDDDAIAIRHMQYLALSFDHRVIDGATADRFMAKIKDTLQNFPENAV
jgi:2-oxoglutarate dehydrogenase E2 component (dihydrolipoamide succinyltransferase)